MIITPEMLAASNSEEGHQSAVFAFFAINREQYPQTKWMHAIPNANSHRMVREGVRAGVSDMFLPMPAWGCKANGNYYHGLYIEMKAPIRRNQKDGGVSKEQLEFLAYAKEVGYKTAVCYSWIEARDTIIGYLRSAE